MIWHERGLVITLTFDDDTEEVRGGHFCFHEFVSKQLRGTLLLQNRLKRRIPKTEGREDPLW